MENQDIIQPKKSFIRRFWWLGLTATLVMVALAVVAGISIEKNNNSDEKEKKQVAEQSEEIEPETLNFDPDNPSKFIQADFVELDKVYEISKFRSGVGHDFSINSGEVCRSMKHYFASMDPEQPNYKFEGYSSENTPSPTLEKDVRIFSPVDGTLKFVDFDDIPFNHELSISPDVYPGVNIRLMHVQSAPGVKEGKVRAGQLIGLVLANQSFDIAITYDVKRSRSEFKTHYISYFTVMQDEVFSRYQARGVQSREQLIISKEYRDAHPYSCHGKEVFNEYYLQTEPLEANMVHLSGRSEMIKKIDKKYPNPNILKTKDTD